MSSDIHAASKRGTIVAAVLSIASKIVSFRRRATDEWTYRLSSFELLTIGLCVALVYVLAFIRASLP